uniref:Variant surface glycoprotein 553 n=1 Tax=Trypanosoma brucei TaxID=5691 RepID=M4T0A8_9TRYP|nr:variant surface glycoprotein 553 [Trypanosoma brucei]
MNGNMALSLVLLVGLTLSTRVGADSAEARNANNAVTNACQEAELLQHLIEETESRISTLTTGEDVITEEAHKFFLGAARSTGTTKHWQYTALQLAAEQIAAENKAKNKETQAALKDVLQTLLRRQAQVELYHKMSDYGEHTNGKSVAKGATQARKTTGTLRMCVVEFAAKAAKTAKCRKPDIPTEHINKIKEHLEDADGITGIKDAAFRRPKITAVAESSTQPGGDTPNPGTEVCSSGSSGTLSTDNALAVTYLKIDPTDNQAIKESIQRPPGQPQGCKEHRTDQAELLVTQAAVANALCKLQTTKPTKAATIGQLTVTALQTNPTLQKIAMLITGDPNAEATTDAMNAAVKKLFGESTETVQKTYLDPLTTDSIQFKVAGTAKEGTIASFTDKTDYTEALAYLLGQDFKTEKVKKAQATAATKPTTEKCKEYTEKDKCTADKDCEHKNGKCKLKEGVKVENDAKPTNTTGNNSVIINKTPLLLAVLHM